MSNLKGQKKALPALSVILYGLGGLSATAEVIFLLLFPALFSHVNTVILLVCVLAGIMLSVLVMPFFYSLINGNTSISTGRYHLSLAVSGLISPFTFLLTFAIGGGAVASAFGIVGLVFLHALSAQIFAYTYFAVGVRFDRSGTAGAIGRVFAFAGFVAAGVGVMLLCDGTRESIGSAMAFGAIVYAAATVCVYFATVRAMPKFIRLEPKHRRSVKENYARFVKPLGNRFALMYSVTVFLVCVSAALIAAVVPSFVCMIFASEAYGYNLFYVAFTVSAAVAGVLIAVNSRREKSGAVAAIVLGALMLAASAGVTVLLYVSAGSVVNTLAAYGVAVFVGLGAGAGIGAITVSKRTAAIKSDCTQSKFTALSHCVGVLGTGVGLSLASGIYLIARHASIRAAAASGVIAAAIIALAGAIVLKIAYKDNK